MFSVVGVAFVLLLKNDFNFSMAWLTGLPCERNGTAGWGFLLSSAIRFSTAVRVLSSLDVSGMGNFVGWNATVVHGSVERVSGM